MPNKKFIPQNSVNCDNKKEAKIFVDGANITEFRADA